MGYAAEPPKSNHYSDGFVDTCWLNDPLCKRREGLLAPGTKGPHIDSFPSGFAAAPVVWVCMGSEKLLTFHGGFVGAAQDDDIDGTVRPELGWYIALRKD